MCDEYNCIPKEVTVHNSNDKEKNVVKKCCSSEEDDYKIDKLFYKICAFCFCLGVNFYRSRPTYQKILSWIIVGSNCFVCLYFIGYITLITYKSPFNPDTLATTLGVVTWSLQAISSTLFLAYWQSTGQACKMLRHIYNSNKGVGIHYHRHHLLCILKYFHIVIASVFIYKAMLVYKLWSGDDSAFFDKRIVMIFGDRRLFLIIQFSQLYISLCWAVALFVFTLLVHSTNYEFMYYNEQVRAISNEKHRENDTATCDYILQLLKIHNRLTECVKHLDMMFHRYAFLMIATIIPSMTFALFMVFRRTDKDMSSRIFDLIFACPIVCFCIFSFFTLTNAPSKLHETIHTTKKALCANTDVWFPYRPNVYHSALAFVCHLDQTNLGVSIWGFAIVSKPLVLTTLSVMVTCLAMFMQLGECKPQHVYNS